MRLKQCEIEKKVKHLFPKARFIGKGVFKVVYALDDNLVLKVNRSRGAGRRERKAFKRLPEDFKAVTFFPSSRFQFQELATKVGEVPSEVLMDLQRECKGLGVINVTKNNVGLVRGTWRVIDCFPVGWSK